MALNHNNYKQTHPFTVRAKVGTDRCEVADEIWYSIPDCYAYPRCVEYLSGVRHRVYRFTPDEYRKFLHTVDALPCACDASEALNICTCAQCGVTMSHTQINLADGFCKQCFTKNNEGVGECEDCGGTGGAWRQGRGMAWDGSPDEYWQECYTCEGSGWSGKSIDDTWKATLEF